MKGSRLFAVLFACSFSLIFCSEDDEIQSVDFIPFSIIELCEGSVLRSSTEKERTIVITSQQELSKETGCLTTVPQIDFNTHFVLAGRVIFNNCAELEHVMISQVDNILKYHIQINQKDCEKIDTVYFMAAVPIRYKDNPIDFDIIY